MKNYDVKISTPLFDDTESPAEKFDRENPLVWREFCKIALNLIGRGKKHYGAKAIFEDLRHHRNFVTSDGDYKLNNNLTSYYARKFQRLFPQHKDFFETRNAKQ